MNTDAELLTFVGSMGALGLILIVVLVVWTVAIKGVALWKSARNGHTAWFVVLLLVNTIGILELIYLLGFAKKRATPVVSSTPGV